MKELEELKRVLEFESKTNGKIPKPNYLYVANYGRSAKEYANQFMAFSGKKSFFYYKPRYIADKPIEDSFDNEINRNKPIGKDYDGVIIINLSSLESDISMDKFIGYLKDYYNNNYIVFEINDAEDAENVRRKIGKHLFVRIIEAPKYSKEEMLSIIKKVVNDYNTSIPGMAIKYLLNWAITRTWEKNEDVETKLVSVTKDLLYEIGVSQNAKAITKEKVQAIIDKEEWKITRKKIIGFQLGG